MTDRPMTAAGRALRDTWDEIADLDSFFMGTEGIDDDILAIEAQAFAAGRDKERERVHVAREALAALEHEQWEKWSREVAASGLTAERIERWTRYWVPYADLDEPTKDRDRKWADRVLDILDPAEGE